MSEQAEFMVLLMVFNLWIVPGSLVVAFQFLNSHFPATTLGQDLFSGVCLNKLWFLWCPLIKNSSF